MKTKLFIARRAFIGRLRPFISRAAAFIARRAICLVRAGFKPAPYCLLLLATAPAFAQTPHLLVCAGKGYTIQSPQGNDAAGSALTFTWYEKAGSGDYKQIGTTTVSSYPVAAKKVGGTYSYVRKAANAECQGVPSNTYTIVVLAPAVPAIAVSAAAVCQNEGDVVFSITPAANTTFTWTKLSGTAGAPSGDGNGTYTVSGASTGTTSVTAAASVTYRIPGLDAKVCVSGTATAQSAVVYPLPVVAQTGAGTWCGSGAHTLTVDVSETGGGDVSVAWYTNPGLSGGTVSDSYTVPAATSPEGVQTYTYYVQATANACTGAAATVTGARNLFEGELDGIEIPPHAKTGQIWVVTGNGGEQTWSDVINVPDCNKEVYDGTKSDCRNNDTYGYLYSWHYVNANANTLCPSSSGWRVPSSEDFCNLDKNLNNSSSCSNDRSGVTGTTYNGSAWGGSHGGYCQSDGTLTSQDGSAGYWSSTATSDDKAFELSYTSAKVYPQNNSYMYYGQPVRCVK